MIRYTTPAIRLSVKGADLTGKNVYVSLKQGDLKMLKTGSDLTVSVATVDDRPVTTIALSLTQEESSVFKYGVSVDVQVNWISSDGIRGGTGIKQISVKQNLLDSVISYED